MNDSEYQQRPAEAHAQVREPVDDPGPCDVLGEPPKWAIIWSARMIAIAIVIRACRSSWPWFQRRNACWMPRPTIRDADGDDRAVRATARCSPAS